MFFSSISPNFSAGSLRLIVSNDPCFCRSSSDYFWREITSKKLSHESFIITSRFNHRKSDSHSVVPGPVLVLYTVPSFDTRVGLLYKSHSAHGISLRPRSFTSA